MKLQFDLMRAQRLEDLAVSTLAAFPVDDRTRHTTTVTKLDGGTGFSGGIVVVDGRTLHVPRLDQRIENVHKAGLLSLSWDEMEQQLRAYPFFRILTPVSYPEGNLAVIWCDPDSLRILAHAALKHFRDGEAPALASFMTANPVQVERSDTAKDLIASSTLGSRHLRILLCYSMRT